MLPENHIKEGISRAYLKAVCNRAGYNIGVDENDFGIDLTIKDIAVRPSGRTYSSGINLDVQIKSTEKWEEDGDDIVYRLRKKNYNDLVSNEKNGTKRILVVLFLPNDNSQWVNQTVESLIIKKCAYWHYLGDQALVSDDGEINIKIPKQRVFSEEALKSIMDAVKSGVDLSGL